MKVMNDRIKYFKLENFSNRDYLWTSYKKCTRTGEIYSAGTCGFKTGKAGQQRGAQAAHRHCIEPAMRPGE
jgi:hypothetical protein